MPCAMIEKFLAARKTFAALNSLSKSLVTSSKDANAQTLLTSNIVLQFEGYQKKNSCTE
jgi:hypothetical protein